MSKIKNKKFGFACVDGNFPAEVRAKNEKEALHKFIDKHWKLINEKEAIYLYGEVLKNQAK